MSARRPWWEGPPVSERVYVLVRVVLPVALGLLGIAVVTWWSR